MSWGQHACILGDVLLDFVVCCEDHLGCHIETCDLVCGRPHHVVVQTTWACSHGPILGLNMKNILGLPLWQIHWTLSNNVISSTKQWVSWVNVHETKDYAKARSGKKTS